MEEIRRILTYPNPKLRVQAETVGTVDAAVRKAADRMFDLMYEARGVGLAATQVGVPVRLFVMDLGTEGPGPEVLVDPVILEMDGEQASEEGCLSFPEIYGPIRRAARVTLAGRDLDGRTVRIVAEGLRARALQHELDHLNGRLIVDRMDPAGLKLVRDRVKALETAWRKSTKR